MIKAWSNRSGSICLRKSTEIVRPGPVCQWCFRWCWWWRCQCFCNTRAPRRISRLHENLVNPVSKPVIPYTARSCIWQKLGIKVGRKQEGWKFSCYWQNLICRDSRVKRFFLNVWYKLNEDSFVCVYVAHLLSLFLIYYRIVSIQVLPHLSPNLAYKFLIADIGSHDYRGEWTARETIF